MTPRRSSTIPPGGWLVGGYRVNNFDGKSFGEHTFADAFAHSVNTTFAKVGSAVGGAGAEHVRACLRLRPAAAVAAWRLGGQLPRSRQAWTRPTWPRPPSVRARSWSRPCRWRWWRPGVANGGQIMRPYVVSEVRDYNQQVLEKTEPGVWLQPISAATAATLRDLMVKVVDEGHGNQGCDRGRQGCGQDRHCGDRRSGGALLVHRVRACRCAREWP